MAVNSVNLGVIRKLSGDQNEQILNKDGENGVTGDKGDDGEQDEDVFNDANEECLLEQETSGGQRLAGNYGELNLKRISVSKCFSNAANQGENTRGGFIETTTAVGTNEPLSFLMSSFQSLSKSRSRSSSSSTSADLSQSSLVYSTNKQLAKKIKLSSIVLQNASLNASVLRSQTAANSAMAVGTGNKPLSRFKKIKHKFQKSNKKSTLVGSGVGGLAENQKNFKKSNKPSKKSIRNKFSKLNENENLSRSHISSSISNFSISNSKKRLVKCLFVGDAQVGKSTLLTLFLKRIFQSEYKPTIVDDYEGSL
jgi:hypothetical protein